MPVSFTIILLAALSFVKPANSAEILRAVTANLPPLEINDSSGQEGFNVEIFRDIAKRAGYEPKVDFLPWINAQQKAKDEEGLLVIGVTRTAERERDYIMLVPLIEANVVFATNSKTVNSFEEAKTLKFVTVAPGTPQESQLKAAGVTHLDPVESYESASKMLEAGRVEAWFAWDIRAKYAWKKFGLDPTKLVLGRAIRVEQVYVAANKKSKPDIQPRLEVALADCKRDGTYQRIYEKYFGK